MSSGNASTSRFHEPMMGGSNSNATQDSHENENTITSRSHEPIMGGSISSAAQDSHENENTIASRSHEPTMGGSISSAAQDSHENENTITVKEGFSTVSTSSLSSSDILGSSGKPNHLTGDSIDIKGRGSVNLAIASFFQACGIPFDMVRSPYFDQMVRAVHDSHAEYKPPSCQRLCRVLVDKEKARLEKVMEPLKASWAVNGCSIVMVGRTDSRNNPLLNIIATSTSGPYLLRVIDCSGKKKNAVFLKDQLCQAIDRVGPSNVVQVITDTTPICKAAGLMIQKQYAHIFWMPCYVQAFNNALKDIGRINWIAKLIKEAKKVQTFILPIHQSQAIYTPYYIFLQKLWEVKEVLCAVVVSDMWASYMESSLDMAIEVKRKVLDDNFWDDIRFVVDLIEPICDMIHNVDIDKPSLGQIYENINSVCERIKSIAHERNPNLYPRLEQCIHGQWNKLNAPLLMASYAFNPKWNDIGKNKRPLCSNRVVMEGFRTAVRKIYGGIEKEAFIIRSQFADYLVGTNKFTTREADYHRCVGMDPVDWWALHGNHVPELQRFAIRLLSQAANSSAFKRHSSIDGVICSVKRNQLPSKKEENLVYIHSALQLLSQKDPRLQDLLLELSHK